MKDDQGHRGTGVGRECGFFFTGSQSLARPQSWHGAGPGRAARELQEQHAKSAATRHAEGTCLDVRRVLSVHGENP